MAPTCDVSTFILFTRQRCSLFQNWSAKSALSILIWLSLSGRTSVKRRHWPWWFQSSVPHKVRWEIGGKFIIFHILHTPHSSFSIQPESVDGGGNAIWNVIDVNKKQYRPKGCSLGHSKLNRWPVWASSTNDYTLLSISQNIRSHSSKDHKCLDDLVRGAEETRLWPSPGML